MHSEFSKPVAVWDLPTRIFHWALVVLIGANLMIGGEEAGLAFRLHVVFGYLIAALIVFRLVWGVIGSPHSLFSDFVVGKKTVVGYARRLLRLDPPHHVGHNPLGGWMVVLLLTMLGLVTVTGLFAHGRRTAGPLADLIARPLASVLGDLHGAVSNLLIVVIVLHVAGVVVDWLLTRVNLVRAMITGTKELSEVEARREPPLAPAWRAAVVAVCVLVALGWAFARTDLTELSKPEPSGTERSRSVN